MQIGKYPAASLLACILFAAATAGVLCGRAYCGEATGAGGEGDGEGRVVALWVTRWDYRSRADVEEAIARAADLGATDVLWQVRGQADAFYRSELEPWGRELFRDLPPSSTDPGYDPLEHAVREAHSRGLKLHAWVNVMPLWKGTEPPADKRHLLRTRPEWRLYDRAGAAQPLNDHYVIVNPVLTEVHDHIVAVFRDIVSRYRVDGLHMDYVRFVSDTMKDAAAYPADERSLAMFRARTGRAGVESAEDRAAFRAFVRERITELVERIGSEAARSRPGVEFSAAVWRRPELARDQYLQDAAAWAERGVVDRLYPMIYSKDDARYADDLKAWLSAAAPSRVYPGIANYMHAPGQTSRQIEEAIQRGCAGVGIFAYASLFESVDPNQDKAEAQVKERSERLRSLREGLRKAPSGSSLRGEGK